MIIKEIIYNAVVYDNKEMLIHDKSPEEKIWWASKGTYDNLGEFIPDSKVRLFSFDRVKWFDLARDYPNALTPEEKEMFNKENSFWAEQLEDKSLTLEEKESIIQTIDHNSLVRRWLEDEDGFGAAE